MHPLDMEAALDLVREHGYRTVLIEVPEGVRGQAVELAAKLREAECTGIVWTGTCWGPCDLHEREVAPYVDAVLHFGHTPLPECTDTPIPVHFLHIGFAGEVPDELVPELRERLAGRPAALLSTVQYLHLLPALAAALDDAQLPAGSLAPGQVTGCDQSAALAASEDRVLVFLGTGRFHPLGAVLATERPVLVLDLERGLVEEVGREEAEGFRKKRYLAIARALDARRWGVYLATKTGQSHRERALELARTIEEAGREAVVVAADDISPDALRALRLDVLVDTACPRIALDDGPNYPFPVLTPVEAEIALGRREYEEWVPPLRGIRDGT